MKELNKKRIKNKREATLHAATEGKYHRIRNTHIVCIHPYTPYTLYTLYVYRDVYTKKNHTFNARIQMRATYVPRTYARMRKIANVHVK